VQSIMYNGDCWFRVSQEAMEKDPSAWMYNWDTLFLGEVWESLKLETVKRGREPRGTPKNDCAGEA
jgi:hypothetical protein